MLGVIRQVGCGFNPTLVRLRQFLPERFWSQCIAFQSHAGSIEALLQTRTYDTIDDVSIPRWFD